MFHMMNEARIGVGLGAVACSAIPATCTRSTMRATGRRAGHSGGQEPVEAPQVPIIEHADVQAHAAGAKGLCRGRPWRSTCICAHLVDERENGRPTNPRVREARPVAGLADADREVLALAVVPRSQQSCDPGARRLRLHPRLSTVEQFYRDNRLNPIHEGTHGIQGLDLLGRKVVMQGGAALKALAARVRATIARCEAVPDAGSQRLAGQLEAQWDRLEQVTAIVHEAGDTNRTLANASVYLEAFGHIVVAWMWLEQALVAGRSMTDAQDDDFYLGKLAACRFFFAFELPKVGPMLDLLASLDDTTLTMRDAWF